MKLSKIHRSLKLKTEHASERRNVNGRFGFREITLNFLGNLYEADDYRVKSKYLPLRRL